MIKRRLLLAILTMVMMVIGGVAPAMPVVGAQDSAVTQPVGMVSDAWRVMAWQFAFATEFPDQGLETREGSNWGILTADITNTGIAGGISVADVKLGDSDVGGDPAESARVSRELGFDAIGADGVLPVAENGIARVAVVMDIPEGVGYPAIRVGDESVSVESVMTENLDIAALPEVPAGMQIAIGTIQAVPSAGTLSVTMQQTGETREISLAGIQAPPANQCYGPESVQLVNDTTGGTIWVEMVPGVDTPTVWYNDVANASFGLLGHTLIAAGAANSDGSGVYGSWLAPIADKMEAQKAGLWQNCKSADGAYINPPTPTPVPTPSAEEIRNAYTWVDNRELIARPFQFEGEKIAVAGEVFTLEVDERGTGLQIWVDTPNGREAVVVVIMGNQTPGLYEGMWVTVYGTGEGVFTGTNGFGAQITQPMIRADIIDY